MEKKRKRKAGRKSRKRRVILIVLGVILVLVILFLLLFKLDRIIVTGNTRYTDEQIKSLCIDENGYNNTVLYYLFKRRTDTKDVPLLEYIDAVYVDRNTIQLRAHEKLTIGMFRVGDKVCCIDQDGVVIEILDYAAGQELNLPIISGLGSRGTVGEKIELEDESVLNVLFALKSSFDRHGITPEYIYIEKEGEGDKAVNTYSLRFGNVKVLLGEDENLEEKMRRVGAIIPMISDRSGVLHMENFSGDKENIVFDTNAPVE